MSRSQHQEYFYRAFGIQNTVGFTTIWRFSARAVNIRMESNLCHTWRHIPIKVSKLCFVHGLFSFPEISPRILQDFFKISSRCLQDFFKTFSGCLKISSKTSSRFYHDVFKMSQDFTKTSWMRWRSSIFWYSSGAILRNWFSFKSLWFVKNGLAVALPAKIFMRGVPTSPIVEMFSLVSWTFPSRFLHDFFKISWMSFVTNSQSLYAAFSPRSGFLTHSVVYAPVLQYCIVFPTVHNTVL